MTTWYRTSKFDYSIEPVEIVKSTEKTVVVKAEKAGHKDRRHDITSIYETYHPTWRQAHEYLLLQARTSKEFCESRLERAKEELVSVCNMREPGV